MSLKVASSGILREDIKLLRGEETLLFDPGADAYFKVSPKLIEVISFMTEDMPIEEFQKKLDLNGVVISIEELQEIIIFLKQNNLQVPAYGEMSIKKQNLEKVKGDTRFLRFCAAYLFFRLPPWRPARRLQRRRRPAGRDS